MANELKPKKGAVVTEINGVKYFKLQSKYPGDYTKNCGLLGNEIDENFYFLRSNDIEKMSMDNGILTLTRVDGDTLSADVSMPYTFEFDQKTGRLIITDGNGDVQILDGFVVEGKDVRVATDATLNGDGTKGNPLRISELEKTGTYAPANEFIDMAVYDYYVKVCEVLYEDTKVYYYVDYSGSTEGIDFIEYSEKPTEGVTWESPKYIKVREDINLPDGSKLGAGYRVVTRESIDRFGLLYNYDGVKKIQEALDETGSLWRVPTRRDWGLMLNAAEYCEDDRDHDTRCVNEWTGKNAGARAKSTILWKKSNKQEGGLPVGGEDSLPIAGTNKFTVYPLGYADGSRGADDKDFDLEAFSKKASYWSNTSASCNDENCSSNIFTRTFAYDTRKVLQESSKPSSRMSLRLVRDYKPGQMDANEVENILGYNMPVVLISNDETGYSKLWTAINVGFREPQYDGVYSNEWSAATGLDRGAEVVYYLNEWDGQDWHKKQMQEGDSIVLLDGGKDESGNTIYNHEWRIYSGDTEPLLIDTAEALKEEFQEEIDALNDRVDTVEEKIEEISGLTETILIASAETPDETILASYVLKINDEQRGVRIDIPKDEFAGIKTIEIGWSGATIDPETGEFTYKPTSGDTEVLDIVYKSSDGVYKLSEIDIETLIHENEFEDGLVVVDHVVKVKIDEASDEYLTVSPDGVKLSGIKERMDNIQAELDTTQEGAGLNEDGTYSPDVMANYINEATSLKDADSRLDEILKDVDTKLDNEIERSKYIDTNIAKDVIGVRGSLSGNAEDGFAIDFAEVEYKETEETPTEEPVIMARIPSHEDIIASGDTAPLYINVGGVIYKITPNSNYINDAKNVFEALKALDDEAKDIDDRVDAVEDEFDALTERVDELSEKVVNIDDKIEEISGNVETLNNALEDEVRRATEAEESLAEQDIAEDGHEMTVDQLTLKRNNGEEIAIPLNFNFGNEMPLVL